MSQSLPYDLSMDWAMLEEQKAYLLELIEADERAEAGLTKFGRPDSDPHPLEGIVQLIDAIQDQGEAMGERVYSDDEADAQA